MYPIFEKTNQQPPKKDGNLSFLKRFNRRHVVWALLFMVLLIGFVAWGNFMPKKFLFECKGYTVRLETDKTSGEVRTQRFFDPVIVRLYEYFWGLDYSLNEFKRNNCFFLRDDGEVFCSQGEYGKASYRDASLNLHKRTRSYEWTIDGQTVTVKYSSDINWTCEKTTSLIED